RRRRDVSAAAPASTRQRRTAFLAEAIGRTILVATRLASHRHRWNVPAWHPTSFRDARRVGAAGRPDTKHGVTFFEAASVFTDPEGLDLPDDAHSAAERSSWRIGMSDEGRVLTVVYAVRRFGDGETIRIISARAASRKERAAYASREDLLLG